jgi:hypothetical protein
VSGTDEIRTWYDHSSKQTKARFFSRIKILAQLPLREWNENFYKSLHGPCAGLSEFRFKSDNTQQRPLGFHSGENEFTILYCAIEKGGKFVPLSACEKALARKAVVQNERNRTNALWLPLE